MSSVYRLIDAQERIYNKARKQLKAARACKPDYTAAASLGNAALSALVKARKEGERTSMPELEEAVEDFKEAVEGLPRY